jgi:carboxyl-terminal processing protease
MRTFLSPLFALGTLVAQEQPAITTIPAVVYETGLATVLIEQNHYSRMPVAKVDFNEVVLDYCKSLDPAKLYFTQQEIDYVKSHFVPTLETAYRQGNLTPALQIYSGFAAKVKQRSEFALATLMDPLLDLNREGVFPSDRRKASWPADPVQSDDLWRKRVQLDLLGELLGKQNDGQKDTTNQVDTAADVTPERLAEAKETIRKRYARMVELLSYEPHELQEMFINALTRQYDPHSNFMSRQSLEEFEIQMKNKLCGIGASLQDEDGYCVIKEIMPGGPLAIDGRAKSGDRIIAVSIDGQAEPEDVVGMRLNKVTRRLRGEKGTPVRLILEPAAGGPRKDLKLVRDELKIVGQLASARCFEVPSGGATQTIGLIDLPAFYMADEENGGPTKHVEELIGKLRAMGMDSLVLDLRRNGGGVLGEAVGIAGLFIPQGPVMQVRDGADQRNTLADEDPKVAWDGPLVVLTSKASASASEIVAGALRDHRRALIVGDVTTHGKGTVQNLMELSRVNPQLKATVKFTIQKWYAPSGSSIQLKGVPSDVLLPSVFSVMPVAESDLDRPMPWDEVASVLSKESLGASPKAPITAALVDRLAKATAQRQKSSEEFAVHKTVLDWTSARMQRKQEPVSLGERLQERVADDQLRDEVRKSLETFAARDFPNKEIKLDAAIAKDKEADADWLKFSRRFSRIRLPIEGDEWPEYDIQLREALRIAADWSAQVAGK